MGVDGFREKLSGFGIAACSGGTCFASRRSLAGLSWQQQTDRKEAPAAETQKLHKARQEFTLDLPPKVYVEPGKCKLVVPP